MHSPAFAQLARSPDHPTAFTRARKLPLPTLIAALLSFRGGSVQSELDTFFDHLGAKGEAALVSDRALAKARSKLHVPALWALNERLLHALAARDQLSLFKGRRLVCADGTLLAPAQRACLRTRCLAAPRQRALGLYLPGNELMLHVAVGPEAQGPDGHPKLLHLWPVKLLQAGRSDYDYVGVMAMREAASFRR